MAGQLEGLGAPLRAGTRAPEFTLASAPDQTVSLRGLRGRPVILAGEHAPA